jgi:hypothetical protein
LRVLGSWRQCGGQSGAIGKQKKTNKKMKVALIIIYNHQYNKNIDIIEQIYKDRFSDIYHLVPFYNGEKENVIPVYECSYYFQGYVSQGLHGFFKEKYSHYFFVADDMILNPIINENNYCDIFNLEANTSFIPGFITLHEEKYWRRIGDAFRWNIRISGVEASNMLPSYENTLNKFSKFGLTIKPLSFSQIWKPTDTWFQFFCSRKFLKRFGTFCMYLIHGKKNYTLSYPIVGSYSDIFIISANSIKEFCHYCGIFATTKLFVEVALPTSVVLSSEEIITEKDLNFKGKALWTTEDYKELEKFENSLTKLMDNFPPNYIYLHPIKLSQWKTEK